MTKGHKTRSVAIVGAGPVGALMAVYFANRGWKVHVYETRPGTEQSYFFPQKHSPTPPMTTRNENKAECTYSCTKRSVMNVITD